METIGKKKSFTFLYQCAGIGLGIVFILSGIRKLFGIKFTSLPIDSPVGTYFNAIYNTGFYWNL